MFKTVPLAHIQSYTLTLSSLCEGNRGSVSLFPEDISSTEPHSTAYDKNDNENDNEPHSTAYNKNDNELNSAASSNDIECEGDGDCGEVLVDSSDEKSENNEDGKSRHVFKTITGDQTDIEALLPIDDQAVTPIDNQAFIPTSEQALIPTDDQAPRWFQVVLSGGAPVRESVDLLSPRVSEAGFQSMR